MVWWFGISFRVASDNYIMDISDVYSLFGCGLVVAIMAVIAGILWERSVRQNRKSAKVKKAIQPRWVIESLWLYFLSVSGIANFSQYWSDSRENELKEHIPMPYDNLFQSILSLASPILGDPGATSWDDAISLGDSLLQELKSPWELILTETVPEVVEFRPADWAEKYASSLRISFRGSSAFEVNFSPKISHRPS